MTIHRTNLRQKLRYRFDDTMSSGVKGMVLWLAAATLALILVVGVVATLIGVEDNEGNELPFGEALWINMLRTLDPGTMGGDEGWTFRIASLIVTIGGLLVVSSLIGLLANGIADKVADLRRGRSPVLESGHTLILGWSAKVYPIVSELVIANENQKGASVVILAPMDKAEMEDRIDARIAEMKTTRVVCRTGNPYEPLDIEITGVERAKAVIVLNRGGPDGDAEVVKATLAVLRTADIAHNVPIIAEIQDTFSGTALKGGTKGAVEIVRSAGIIAKLTAQVCRQPGLSYVYQELFDFDGDEIYFSAVPELEGKTFGDALLAFDKCTPLGLQSAAGEITVNPSMSTPFNKGDKVIAIAEDDDKVLIGKTRSFGHASADAGRGGGRVRDPERILLIGWNDMAPNIITELDGYAAPGSTMTIFADDDVVLPEDIHLPETKNLACTVSDDDLDPDTIGSLMTDPAPDHAIVLCYRGRLSEAQADARVMLTLLHLRSAIEDAGAETNIVAELLDERDVDLTPKHHTDEFIVSERLTALLMAQLSENPALAPVFEDLLDEEGSEIYLKPAALYADAGQTHSFADVVAAARSRGETALGYQTVRDGRKDVAINPHKDETVTFAPGDSVVVLSELED